MKLECGAGGAACTQFNIAENHTTRRYNIMWDRCDEARPDAMFALKHGFAALLVLLSMIGAVLTLLTHTSLYRKVVQCIYAYVLYRQFKACRRWYEILLLQIIFSLLLW